MFVVQNYAVAVVLCVATMLCWGSWANTQKLAGARWRFELFYWDYVLGLLLASLVYALTLGSMGTAGRGFLADLRQADAASLGWALLGGVVFNAANILLVAAIAIAGMAVAFPVGIGLALVLGVLWNYLGEPAGNAGLLFGGVALVTAAIVLDALAYRRLPGRSAGGGAKGLILSVVSGILMSLFYFLVMQSLAKVQSSGGPLLDVTVANLAKGELQAGKLTPLSANFVFVVGILASNFVFNTAVMRKPFVGAPVPLGDYFKGTAGDHLWGVVGGCIWTTGMAANVVASCVASRAVSYGLVQGATMVAAIWGVFIWREFRTAPAGTTKLLALMFLAFLSGLTLVIWAKI
jgi:glucose uptake protein